MCIKSLITKLDNMYLPNKIKKSDMFFNDYKV